MADAASELSRGREFLGGSSGDAAKPQKKKKSGGFQSMGLSKALMQGIKAKGYNLPTPIQRKVIPLALGGSDVVAMARTGSGKTAAFLIPILHKLVAHSTQAGARALVVAPTRELALQSQKFAREIGKFLDLQTCTIIGGEGIEAQFDQLANNPDIIFGTPGRVMHVIQETGLSLRSVEVAVFDEADRLFEMGFAEQLNEILGALGDTRQTMLFSATMPKLLVQFASAGLKHPEFVRLDTEAQLSPDLQTAFITIKSEDKEATLVYLLTKVIPESQQTIVFASTKHHVEYLQGLLEHLNVPSVATYGSMDQMARKISLAKFRKRQVCVLLVTDVAARGIDVPLLDNVINYDFPSSAKLFVHRSGRVARAGRPGVAYSFVTTEDYPYMLDLMLFLGRTPMTAPESGPLDPQASYYGRVPRPSLDPINEEIKNVLADHVDVEALKHSSVNAWKLYVKTRGKASSESTRRGKELPNPPIHPLFAKDVNAEDEAKQSILDSLKKFRPQQTVFELDSALKNTPGYIAMQAVRQHHMPAIEAKKRSREDEQAKAIREKKISEEAAEEERAEPVHKKPRLAPEPEEEEEDDEDEDEDEDMQGDGSDSDGEKSSSKPSQNPFYISSLPSAHNYERALELGETGAAAADMTLEINGEDTNTMRKGKLMSRWDRRKKKYVMSHGGIDPVRGKVIRDYGKGDKKKPERGELYRKWMEQSKRTIGGQEGGQSHPSRIDKDEVAKPKKNRGRKVRSELKSFEQVRKQRKIEERRREHYNAKHSIGSKSSSGGSGGAPARGGKGGKGPSAAGSGRPKKPQARGKLGKFGSRANGKRK
eukprot:m51a1_g11791 putatative ATP-dependent RNA helicase (823) ;mRNA; r:306111-308630